MDTSLTNEKQLLADIDDLREQFPQTQDLYREVCITLFFRYGMTPTANKLYQLVRKGSMSAPSEALNKFWEDLREKSRVRIEHPDLPDALKTAAGELTVALWSSAQALANDSLASCRNEAQLEVIQAKTAVASALTTQETTEQSLKQTSAILAQALKTISQFEQHAAATTATQNNLEARLTQLQQENIALQQRLAEARQDFTTELDKYRTIAEAAETRFKATETRSLLEIDRERTIAIKLQKELEQTRSSSTQVENRARENIATLQAQIGDLRQQLGMLDGQLHAAVIGRDTAMAETKQILEKLLEASTQLSIARLDVEFNQKKLEELKVIKAQTKHDELKPPRSARKVKGT